MGSETGTTELIPFTTRVPTWINNSGWKVNVFSVGNKEKTLKSFLLKELLGILSIDMLYIGQTSKEVLYNQGWRMLQAENAHSEFDTWRSPKLVRSTGNGHKAGQSLVFNLDLGWRCCKRCSLSPDWAGIAPALFLSEGWHSERFHRACSQEGKVLHRGLRASKDVRCAGCCALNTQPCGVRGRRADHREGSPGLFPAAVVIICIPSWDGWEGATIFPGPAETAPSDALPQRFSTTEKCELKKKKKSEFVIFSCTILKKTLNLGFVLEI